MDSYTENDIKKGQTVPDLFVMVPSNYFDTARRITLYRFLQDEPLDIVLFVVRFLFSSLPCLAGKACILQRTSGRSWQEWSIGLHPNRFRHRG